MIPNVVAYFILGFVCGIVVLAALRGGIGSLLDGRLALVTQGLTDVFDTMLTDAMEEMRMDLSRIQAAVERETTVTQSAIALCTGLAAQAADLSAKLDAALKANDPAAAAAVQQALDDLAAKLNSDSDALASAVTANTTAAPTPAPVPPAPAT